MPTAKIKSRAALFGHPLHPALIHFPVAALIMLLASDAAYFFTEDTFWAQASYWLAVVGVAGGVISGLAGAVDLFTVLRIRRLVSAWAHGLLAAILLSVATFNFMLRLEHMADQIVPWGLYMSALTVLLIAITGVLGAQLVYEYGVGVDIEEATRRDVQP